PKSAQFWKLCNQRTARNWSHSGHTDQELLLCTPERVLLDAVVDFIIYAHQLLIQPADMSFDALLEDGRLDPGETVLLRRLHIDQRPPTNNKGLEFQRRLIWHCPNLGPYSRAKERQDTCIDPVRLG